MLWVYWHSDVQSKVGLDDLGDLFQPYGVYDSIAVPWSAHFHPRQHTGWSHVVKNLINFHLFGLYFRVVLCLTFKTLSIVKLIESIITPASTHALFCILLEVCATGTAGTGTNFCTPWDRTRETDLSCHGVGSSAVLLLQHSLHQLHTLLLSRSKSALTVWRCAMLGRNTYSWQVKSCAFMMVAPDLLHL